MNPRAAVVAVLLVLAAVAWWLTRGLAPAPPAASAGTQAATIAAPAAETADAPANDGAAAAAVAPAPVERHAASADAPSTGEVRVTVRWADDRSPAEGIEVYLSRRGTESQFAMTGRTAVDGAFVFTDLAPGRVRPVVRRGRVHGGEPVEVVAGQRLEATIELPIGLAVTGRVVDDTGAPVADADIVAADWGGGSTEVLGRSASDGTFALRGAPTVCHIGARKRGHRPSPMRTVTTEDGARVEFTIVLPKGGGALAGTVFGPDGEPVEGALVRAGSTEQGNHKLPDGASAMAPQPELLRTDAAGRFEFASAVPGVVPLAVRKPGLAPWSQDVAVDADRATDVSVHLVQGATLLGVVMDADGKPAAETSISIGEWRELGHRSLDTAADGSFRIEGLALGTQKVTARHEQHGQAAATFDFVAGETRRWDVVLDPGEVVRGRVLDHEGQPAAKVIVEAQLDPWQTGDRWFGHANSDEAGRFTLRNCLPGRTIRVTFRRKMFTELTVRDVLPGTEERTFRLPEEHWVHIEGSARGPDGELIPGVRLSPHLETDNSGTPVETVDPKTGAFRLGPYPPGPYSLRVAADGYASFRLRRTLAPDETWDIGELRFERGGTLEVHLVATDDVPVEKARVSVYDAAGDWLTSIPIEAGTGRSEPLLPGDYQLVLGGEIASQHLPFTIREGVAAQLDVRVARGASVTVNCAPPAGEPPRSIGLVVTNATGIVWRGGLWRRGEVFTATLPLAQGTYTATATLGELGAEQTFTVGDEAPVVSLALAPR